jgi:hypothetical protein
VDVNCAPLGYYAASSWILYPFWIPDPWRWDRYVVPKRRREITTTRYEITQRSAVPFVHRNSLFITYVATPSNRLRTPRTLTTSQMGLQKHDGRIPISRSSY